MATFQVLFVVEYDNGTTKGQDQDGVITFGVETASNAPTEIGGTCSATGSAVGGLAVDYEAGGACAGSATVSGTIELFNENMAGTCDAVATVAGTLDLFNGSLAGSCEAVGDVSGSLAREIPLGGSCSALGSAVATAQFTLNMEGTCSATGTVQATASLAPYIPVLPTSIPSIYGH
jgi:hypothetical protein